MGWGPDGREPAPDFQRPLKQARSIPDEEGLYEDDLFIDKRKPPRATGVIPL